MPRPQLTFFCECDTPSLARLLALPHLLPTLRRLGARVSLALPELSAERARLARRFTEGGVPLVAWLLLPPEEGYFCTPDNAPAFTSRYHAFSAWTRAHGLAWEGLGLDVELDLRHLALFSRRPLRATAQLVRKAATPGRLARALATYSQLIDTVHAEGLPVETYQVPPLLDARRASSQGLAHLFGVMDLPARREVLMLYSSLLPLGLAALSSYAPEADAVAVGSTGGGIDTLPKLSWEALARDLTLAARATGQVYVFSLEGCAWRGMLERLEALDWEAAPPQQVPHLRTLEAGRGLLRATLRAASRWPRR